MATAAANLQTAYDNVCKQLADMTATPKPSYSIDGQSVSWTEHYNALLTQMMTLEQAIQRAGGPFDLISHAQV